MKAPVSSCAGLLRNLKLCCFIFSFCYNISMLSGLRIISLDIFQANFAISMDISDTGFTVLCINIGLAKKMLSFETGYFYQNRTCTGARSQLLNL